MNDTRVDGYIFWLAEYLSRKFQDSKRKKTLDAAVKDAFFSFVNAYPVTQGNDNTVNFYTVLKSDDYRRMVFFKNFYGNEYSDHDVENLVYNSFEFSVKEFVNGTPPEYMQDGEYIFSDADEEIYTKIREVEKLISKAFDTTLKPLGKPGDTNRILEMVESEELSVSQAQRDAFFTYISDCLKPRRKVLGKR